MTNLFSCRSSSWLELEKYLPEKGIITTFMSSHMSWRQHLYRKNIFNVSNYYYRKMAIILNYNSIPTKTLIFIVLTMLTFIDTDTLIKISEGTDYLKERTVRTVFVDQTSYLIMKIHMLIMKCCTF